MRAAITALALFLAPPAIAQSDPQRTPPARPSLQYVGTSYDGFITYLDAGKMLNGTNAAIWRLEFEETGAAQMWRRLLVDCKASTFRIDWVVQLAPKTWQPFSALPGKGPAVAPGQPLDKVTVREACSGKPLAASKVAPHTSIAAAAAHAAKIYQLEEEMARDDSGGDPFKVNTNAMAGAGLIERKNLALVRTTPASAPATQNVFFVEVSTIRRTGTIAEAWTLMVLRTRQALPGGGGMDGVWGSARFDCGKGTFQMLASAATHADGRTHSRENVTDPPRHVVTNQNFNTALEIACGRHSVQGAPRLPGAAAAIASVRAPAPAPTPAPPAPAALKPGDLGPVVRIREASRRAGEPTYSGTWTRRGTSNLYDGAWVYDPTGQRYTDILEVVGVQNGQLVIKRRSIDGTYLLPILPNGKYGQGTASWVTDKDYYWTVVP